MTSATNPPESVVDVTSISAIPEFHIQRVRLGEAPEPIVMNSVASTSVKLF